jgi:hypothetical protein
MRITAGRMVIMGGLIATATRIIEITVTTTTQDIVITVITGTKTIAIMATGRAGTMCTKAASIRDAALGIATRIVEGTTVKACSPRDARLLKVRQGNVERKELAISTPPLFDRLLEHVPG